MPRPTTALIVDDQAHVRVFARLLLREVGIDTVWEAADGTAALELLQQHEPQLVLLDVNLPRMSGLEVLAELHEAGWSTPVVMLTSENAGKTVQEAARLGARGYILKHSPRDAALAALRDVITDLADEGDPASDPAG